MDKIKKAKQAAMKAWEFIKDNKRRSNNADKLSTMVMDRRYPGGWSSSEGNVTEKNYIKKGLKPNWLTKKVGDWDVTKEKWAKKNHK